MRVRMEDDEKERVCVELSITAAAGLNRLARFYQVSKDEIVDRLIRKADSQAADKAFNKEGLGGQKVYSDGPQP